MAFPTLVEEIQGHNVTKFGPKEGPTIDIGEDVRLTWKAEGKDTGYAFSCYEVAIAPGRGIPLHKHPYAEFFYVTEGTVDYQRWSDAGEEEWLSCGVGATVLAPPNAPHAFFNRSGAPASFVATSTYHHEVMLKESETPTGRLADGYPNPTPEGFERMMASEQQNQVYYG